MPELSSQLHGLRVFVVEDESLIAMLIEEMFEELGCHVVEAAATLPKALQIASANTFDFALLDVNLNGERVYPVALELISRGVPIAFSTGYGAAGIPPDLSSWPTVAKPFTIDDLVHAMAKAIAHAA